MINKQQLGQTIKSLREERQVSQAKLAKYVGISRPAMSAIETGNRGVEVFELSKIATFFGVKIDELLVSEINKNETSPSDVEVNKDIEFNPEKLQQVLLYVLNKCGGKPNVGETVLYKLLYFIDFNSYEKWGKPIIGLSYVKLQFGPVPQSIQFRTVIKKMETENRIKIFIQEYHDMKQKRYVALGDFNLDNFSIKEKNVIDDVIAKLSDMSAAQIEQYVHEDIPWKVMGKNEVIPYELTVDRETPYAQVDHWQAWQNASGVDSLKHLGPISKEEYNYYENLCSKKDK
ncbi:DUF4065 domain-containing protein [Candidatus Falkowbacteria bacterium]|jgi:transcriptional regulator with XRE-family HTH domain|nr:DUF4065 domain-containing protein [Candidatus Falkowbacteria bacterium]MBT6573843.1 DUF4065 domain-containing protein [Candidatus Falkowbacteria bacterium]MBT7501237.1 DUF4065 domain-containing protein [Candidatus Falkowbacteria bacterium]